MFKLFLSIGASEWLAVLEKYTVLMREEKGELSELANLSGLLTAMVHPALQAFPTALKNDAHKFCNGTWGRWFTLELKDTSMYQMFGYIVSIATKDIEDKDAIEGKEINEGERYHLSFFLEAWRIAYISDSTPNPIIYQ
jgi:hypothetical protein